MYRYEWTILEWDEEPHKQPPILQPKHNNALGLFDYYLCSISFDLYAALMPMVLKTIHEDLWHARLFPSAWQGNCQYIIWRLRHVATETRTVTSRKRASWATATVMHYFITISFLFWCQISYNGIGHLAFFYNTLFSNSS